MSFAIDRLINEYPQTLMTIEWHSDALTFSDTIDFPIPEAYSYRASLYDVGGIPHNQFNGLYEFILLTLIALKFVTEFWISFGKSITTGPGLPVLAI